MLPWFSDLIEIITVSVIVEHSNDKTLPKVELPEATKGAAGGIHGLISITGPLQDKPLILE